MHVHAQATFFIFKMVAPPSVCEERAWDRDYPPPALVSDEDPVTVILRDPDGDQDTTQPIQTVMDHIATIERTLQPRSLMSAV